MSTATPPQPQVTPLSQAETLVASEHNSPRFKYGLPSRAIPIIPGSIYDDETDDGSEMESADDGDSDKRDEGGSRESEISARHLTLDFKAEVLWEDAARSRWHAQTALSLASKIKDTVTGLLALESNSSEEETRPTSFLGLVSRAKDTESSVKAPNLQRLHDIILDAQSIIIRCRALFNLDTVMEWKETQEKLSQLHNKLRSSGKKSSKRANSDDWDSLEMFDKSLFLATLSTESVAMCKQFRKSTEIARIIPLDTVEALLVNLEDMGGIHTERQDTLRLLHFCIDCAICVYMVLEEFQSNLTFTVARYEGGKRYISTIIMFIEEISEALKKSYEAENISYVLACQSHLNEVASFIGHVDSLYTASLVGSSISNAFVIQNYESGTITALCTSWNSSKREKVTFNVDQYLGLERDRLQWGGTKFSAYVQDVTFGPTSIRARTQQSRVSVQITLTGLLRNFNGDLYATPFNNFSTLKHRRSKMYTIPEMSQREYTDIQKLIGKLNDMISARKDFRCSNTLRLIADLTSTTLSMLFEVQVLLRTSKGISITSIEELERVLEDVRKALKKIPGDVWMPLPRSCREAKQFAPVNPTIWERHLFQILEQLETVQRKLSLIYEQLRIMDYSLLEYDPFLSNLSKFGHTHLNGDNAVNILLKMPDRIPLSPSFLPSFLQVEIRSIEIRGQDGSQQGDKHAVICSFAGYRYTMRNNPSQQDGAIAYFPVFTLPSDENRTLKMACVPSSGEKEENLNPDQLFAIRTCDLTELLTNDRTRFQLLPRDEKVDVFVTLICVLLNASDLEIEQPTNLSSLELYEYERNSYTATTTAVEERVKDVEVTLKQMTEPSTLKDCLEVSVQLLNALVKSQETSSSRSRSRRSQHGFRNLITQKGKSVVRGVLRNTLSLFGEKNLETTYLKSRYDFGIQVAEKLIPLIAWAKQAGSRSFYYETDLKTLYWDLKKFLKEASTGHSFDNFTSTARARRPFDNLFNGTMQHGEIGSGGLETMQHDDIGLETRMR